MFKQNKDIKTINGFGDEWTCYNQSLLDNEEGMKIFEQYFRIFPWNLVSRDSEGFDMGCGSGRWAKFVAPHVRKLHCIDPSLSILVAKNNLSNYSNCVFHHTDASGFITPEESMDFGYSLGVLHHIPDTGQAIKDCARLLKPGAPFLAYVYYALDNRSRFYRFIWKITDLLRSIISMLPFKIKYYVCLIISLLIYWPVAKISYIAECIGLPLEIVERIPLSSYRNLSFYTMRTDALDRFGTNLEQRFSREEIYSMMSSAGFIDIRFSEDSPYWCVVGLKGK